jgi:hypothetical protein
MDLFSLKLENAPPRIPLPRRALAAGTNDISNVSHKCFPLILLKFGDDQQSLHLLLPDLRPRSEIWHGLAANYQ